MPKRREIYPDIGICGIDIRVDYDAVQKRWVIDLNKDHHKLKTYLESGDAENCIEGRQCIDLYRKNVTLAFGHIRIRVRKSP